MPWAAAGPRATTAMGARSRAAARPTPSPRPATPDAAASTAVLEQNADELPSATVDSLGHREEVTCNAESPGSARLVVTVTHNDGSTTSVTLDADGNPVRAVDENGLVSTVDYNRAG